MNDEEAIEMMKFCRQEIISMKAQLEHLKPKAEAYDNITSILRLLPKGSEAYTQDLTWRLEKRIKELTPKPIENKVD